MKIKCFSKRKLNVRKIEISINLQPFNFDLQQDLKIAAFWGNPIFFFAKFVKILLNFAKF